MKSARHAALDILLKVELHNAYAAPLLARAMPRFQSRDRRLLVDLVYGVLRWRLTLDWIIARASHRPIASIDLSLLILLRLGAYQLIFLTKIPRHAAVSTSVDLAKSVRGQKAGGFINALLRHIAEKGNKTLEQLPRNQTADALALRTSHPSWLVRRWIEQFGYGETEALCNANNQPPPATLRVNAHKTTRDSLIKDAKQIPNLKDTRINPTRFASQGLSVAPLSAVFETDWLERGVVTIQDEASQIVGEIVSARPGEWILDACAGIGGKALQLLETTDGHLNLICMDAIPRKLKQLHSSAKRLGLPPPPRIAARAEKNPLANHPIFDKVLLDAPCSNTGVIRRHPERKWRLEERDITRLCEVQEGFLTALAPKVRVGGVLVYSTCSLEREEGEEMVSRFLSLHKEFTLDDCAQVLGNRNIPFVTKGMFRSFPHKDGMDGFFCARLIRREP